MKECVLNNMKPYDFSIKYGYDVKYVYNQLYNLRIILKYYGAKNLVDM